VEDFDVVKPKVLAMLIKHGIEGDDALLRLAQVRLQEAGLGAELYPESPEQFDEQASFCPVAFPCTLHLPRNQNLLKPEARTRVLEFAGRAAGRVHGLIVHDHAQFEHQQDETLAAFRDLDRRLAGVAQAPPLFVEYAAGLPLDVFASLFERTRDLRHVSACIDVSHVGIQVCRNSYGLANPGIDVCSLKTAADLPDRMDGIQAAVADALPSVVGLIRRLGLLGKPLHFHCHDGHPLSRLSRYGVSDHLSFVQEIRLPFVYRGRQLVGGMFGLAGLRALMQAALEGPAAEQYSFMIEVHAQEGRAPLGPYSSFFAHWRDRSNAERMNYWLDMLLLNASLLRSMLEPVSGTAQTR
jgi:hypothetical protein